MRRHSADRRRPLREVLCGVMASVLFGPQTLPPFTPGASTSTIEVAAQLLYFDQIYVVRLCDLDELVPRAPIESHVQTIISTYGREAVDEYLTYGGESAVIPDDETAVLEAYYQFKRLDEFLDEYDALIGDGAVVPIAASQLIQSGDRPSWEVIVGSYYENDERWRSLLTADRSRWDIVEQAVGAIGTYNVSTAACARYTVRHRPHEFAERNSMIEGGGVDYIPLAKIEAVALSLYAQSLAANAFGLSSVASSEAVADLHESVLHLLDLVDQPSRRSSDGTDAIASRVVAQTLVALPVVAPRSLDALLEIRHRLAAELAAFRGSVDEVVRDLRYAKTLDARDIEHVVDHKFRRPVEDLRRRFAAPTRDILRNLVTTESVAGYAASFSTTMISGGEVATAQALAALSAIGVSALKTHFERQKQISDSSVAFLLKLVKLRDE